MSEEYDLRLKISRYNPEIERSWVQGCLSFHLPPSIYSAFKSFPFPNFLNRPHGFHRAVHRAMGGQNHELDLRLLAPNSAQQLHAVELGHL